MQNHTRKSPKIKGSADEQKLYLTRWLLSGGMGFNQTTDAIGNEVLFSEMLRRADLLILSNCLHAMEIKGDSDNLSKLACQISDYCRTFDKVSVVTTQKHIRRIRQMLPHKIGIILIKGKDDIKIIRQAKINKKLDKHSILMFLNKCHISSLCNVCGGSYSTGELRQIAATKCSLKMIKNKAHQILREKYNRLFFRFIKEMGKYPFLLDDLRNLSASVSSPKNPKELFSATICAD